MRNRVASDAHARWELLDGFGLTYGVTSVKLLVGLGNPGRRYERTRHNLGFMLLDHIADVRAIRVTDERSESLIGRGQLDQETVVLAKPQTYMNNSGLAVAALVKRFQVQAADLVVIYDDLDLPFGRLRIRCGGSAGGHRGIMSVLQHVADRGFVRLRVGIGRPSGGMDPVDYVLSRFLPEEQESMDGVLRKAGEAVDAIVLKGPVQAMEDFNRLQ